jgi:O-antigen ligase
VPRPRAPFSTTNQWGANVALLTPFFVLHLLGRRTVRWRLATGAVLLAGLVPAVMSLNRGLWMSLGIGLVYVAVRTAARGDRRALLTTIAALAATGALIFLTPLHTIVTHRLEHRNLNDRSALYQEASERALASPVLGLGAPIHDDDRPNGPSVGTHGQFWTVLVSQGVVGVTLFVGWLLASLLATWRAPGRLLWVHAVVLIGMIQLPYYAMVPVPIHLVVVALALLERARAEERGDVPLAAAAR